MGRGYIVEEIVQKYLFNLTAAGATSVTGLLIGQVTTCVCVCVSNQSVSATRAPPLVNVKDIYQNLAVGRVSCLYDYTSERHPGLVPVCRQSAPQRDYVVLAARTPPRDQTGEERGQASSATAAGTALDHETDVEWVSEHARQVRMG